ncbi:YbaK/EbsC family protein [Euzebya tangerina]|uniref:YbaK/EbsC family protein n=1 Tax=Euzebya tangerina TaxID=591198 RepID=UPI000E321A8A|nr:YbaK/EbsC family protein [Euzebya tangerina]
MSFKAATHRVIDAAAELGLELSVQRFPEGTRTAQDAADAIGCGVAAIAKSIVVASDQGAVLVLTSGANLVDFPRVEAAAGVTGVRRASAEEARAATGYAIGGTAPFGLATAMRILADRDLMLFDEVWVAAGTPDTVFPLEPRELITGAGATVADVAQTAG